MIHQTEEEEELLITLPSFLHREESSLDYNHHDHMHHLPKEFLTNTNTTLDKNGSPKRKRQKLDPDAPRAEFVREFLTWFDQFTFLKPSSLFSQRNLEKMTFRIPLKSSNSDYSDDPFFQQFSGQLLLNEDVRGGNNNHPIVKLYESLDDIFQSEDVCDGDVVLLPPGTYHLRSSVVVDKSIEIIGMNFNCRKTVIQLIDYTSAATAMAPQEQHDERQIQTTTTTTREGEQQQQVEPSSPALGVEYLFLIAERVACRFHRLTIQASITRHVLVSGAFVIASSNSYLEMSECHVERGMRALDIRSDSSVHLERCQFRLFSASVIRAERPKLVVLDRNRMFNNCLGTRAIYSGDPCVYDYDAPGFYSVIYIEGPSISNKFTIAQLHSKFTFRGNHVYDNLGSAVGLSTDIDAPLMNKTVNIPLTLYEKEKDLIVLDSRYEDARRQYEEIREFETFVENNIQILEYQDMKEVWKNNETSVTCISQVKVLPKSTTIVVTDEVELEEQQVGFDIALISIVDTDERKTEHHHMIPKTIDELTVPSSSSDQWKRIVEFENPDFSVFEFLGASLEDQPLQSTRMEVEEDDLTPICDFYAVFKKQILLRTYSALYLIFPPQLMDDNDDTTKCQVCQKNLYTCDLRGDDKRPIVQYVLRHVNLVQYVMTTKKNLLQKIRARPHVTRQALCESGHVNIQVSSLSTPTVVVANNNNNERENV